MCWQTFYDEWVRHVGKPKTWIDTAVMFDAYRVLNKRGARKW